MYVILCAICQNQIRVISWLQHPTPHIVIATYNTQCASHLSAVFFPHSQSISLQWQSISYMSSIFGVEIETLAEPWHPRARSCDSEEDRWPNRTWTPGAVESNTSKEYEGQIEDCKSWSWGLARAELRTEQSLHFCELPDSPTSSSEPP